MDFLGQDDLEPAISEYNYAASYLAKVYVPMCVCVHMETKV